MGQYSHTYPHLNVKLVWEWPIYFYKIFNIIDNSQFHITVSVGMTMGDMIDPSADELIRCSDTAMYRAKEKSGNALRIYDDALNTEVQRKIDLEWEAYAAIDNGDFYLALQPLIDLKTLFLNGFEALLRWCHPEKGLI